VEGAETQAPEVGFRIAMLFGPVVGGCFIVAAIIFTFMPLTDEKHKRVQRLLERKRAKHEQLSAE
jgi:GPH family glycoside/pentoside/hexuronide:cation symporter